MVFILEYRAASLSTGHLKKWNVVKSCKHSPAIDPHGSIYLMIKTTWHFTSVHLSSNELSPTLINFRGWHPCPFVFVLRQPAVAVSSPPTQVVRLRSRSDPKWQQSLKLIYLIKLARTHISYLQTTSETTLIDSLTSSDWISYCHGADQRQRQILSDAVVLCPRHGSEALFLCSNYNQTCKFLGFCKISVF
jgi:hypothetical protein